MTMAAVIHEKGGADNFVWEKVPVGVPGGPGEVRLRNTAVGVNFADTYHLAGIPHPFPVGEPPVVVGFEAAGVIEEVGPGVSDFAVGERVCTCLPPLGAYSQERIYPADKLITCCIGHIGCSLEYYVLIHAAAGGMGHLMCPWARHLGAIVIGTVSTEAKAEIARGLGCHYTINYSTEDFVAAVREITGGTGVHVVYDSVGKDTLQKSLDCLRPLGMCAAYGHASGVPDPIKIVQDLGVRGSLFITRPALWHHMASRREIDERSQSLFDAVKAGVLASKVAMTFPLRESAAAHKYMAARKTIGSIVLLPFE